MNLIKNSIFCLLGLVGGIIYFRPVEPEINDPPLAVSPDVLVFGLHQNQGDVEDILGIGANIHPDEVSEMVQYLHSLRGMSYKEILLNTPENSRKSLFKEIIPNWRFESPNEAWDFLCSPMGRGLANNIDFMVTAEAAALRDPTGYDLSFSNLRDPDDRKKSTLRTLGFIAATAGLEAAYARLSKESETWNAAEIEQGIQDLNYVAIWHEGGYETMSAILVRMDESETKAACQQQLEALNCELCRSDPLAK